MGQKNQPPIGPIVGGILGGLTIILLFVLGLVYIRKKVGVIDDEDDSRVITPYTALPAVGPYELADHVRSQTSFSSRRTERTGQSAPLASQRSPPIDTPTRDTLSPPPHSRDNSRNGGLGRSNSLFPAAVDPPILPSKPDSSNGSRSTTPSSGRRGQRSRDADRHHRAAGSSEASSSSSRSRGGGDPVLNRHNSLFATEPLSALPTKSMMFQASGSRPSRHRNMPSLPPPMEDDFLPPGFGQSSSSSSRPPDISKGKLGRVNTLFVPRSDEPPPPLLPEKIMTMSYQHGAMRSQGSHTAEWYGTDRSTPNLPPAHRPTMSNEFDGPPPHSTVIMHADSGVRIPPQPALPDSPPPPISPLSPPPPIDAALNPPLHYPPTPPPDFGR